MNDKCPVCDRLLPPDGDCYGCAADKAWEEIAALRKRLARAEAVADATLAHEDKCRAMAMMGFTDPAEVMRQCKPELDDQAAALAAYKAGKESNAT
jgi:hypothetical protein